MIIDPYIPRMYQTVPRTVYPRGSKNLKIRKSLKPTGFPGLRPTATPLRL